MKQLLLWSDAEIAPAGPARVERKKRKAKLCSACKAKLPKKPRSVMPVGHAFQTVQGILIDRLDSLTDDIARIVGDEVGRRWDADPRQLASCAGRIIDALNYRFFPEAYEDGEQYTPDPAGRMSYEEELIWKDVVVVEDGKHVKKKMAEYVRVPHKIAGSLVPRLPTIAIYARHLLDLGRQSPVCQSLPGVFTDAELARLGERIEKRHGHQRG